ncbi:F-box/kelch-repeat protein At3g06240-like [Papaver somniferum]|uniref:F-box/kelch-repeat protein At3g06240-like n=1 Tax=Papaver somniferum TaxID=3469 RepID=UPI000E6FEC15|nr:F-box/kelch-repeat protein At3g06240-like [Papaver somniferum]
MISIVISPNIAKSKEDRAVIYDVGYDSLFEKSEFDEAAAVEMYPLKSFEKMLGSCNGLVLFSFYKELSSIHGVVHRDKWLRLCLWNPAEHKQLPESQNKILFQRNVMYGFCYDYRNDDYKLFKVVCYHKDTYETLVYVYRLRSNSWRSSQTIPYWFPSDTTSGVVVRNALHWIGTVDVGTRHSSEVIVSLNIRDEILESVLLPKQLSKKEFYTTKIMTVGVLEGCLCVVDLKFLSNEADVWVMQEYGVQESWVKQYSIASGLCINVSYLRLISSKKGKILLQTRSGFILYDLKNSSTRETK